MKTSESLDKFTPAFLAMQKALKHAVKDASNPHFKSTYADLESVWDACREALSANQIGVIQGPGLYRDGALRLATRLLHSSGQWIESTLCLPLDKQNAQGAGSAITYGRRYALAAMTGVLASDDDGNAASAPAPKKQKSESAVFPTKAARSQWVNMMVRQVGEQSSMIGLNELWKSAEEIYNKLKANKGDDLPSEDFMASEEIRYAFSERKEFIKGFRAPDDYEETNPHGKD